MVSTTNHQGRPAYPLLHLLLKIFVYTTQLFPLMFCFPPPHSCWLDLLDRPKYKTRYTGRCSLPEVKSSAHILLLTASEYIE